MKLQNFQNIITLLILSSTIMTIWKISTSFGSSRQQPILNIASPQRNNSHVTASIDVGFPIPSVICGPTSRIGNQLFRYAFAYSLSQTLHAPLYLTFNAAGFSSRKFTTEERSFVLDQFQLDTSKYKYLSSLSELPQDKKNLIAHINEVNCLKNNIPKDKIILVDGYWESEIFFKPYKDEIIPQFQLHQYIQDLALQSNYEIVKWIESSESVAVHFRVGDFTYADRLLPFSYQLEGMTFISFMLQKPQQEQDNKNVHLKFFIFSDDIQFVKQQLELHNMSSSHFQHLNSKLTFVSSKNNTSIEEFYLMNKCKHFIIPNSTFSWWTVYTSKNKNKIVIAPYPRHKLSFFELWKSEPELKKYKMSLDNKSQYPNDWITLNPYK